MELRFNALGYINNRLYHMTFTLRGGAMRVISLRKANSREVRKYAKT
ncbi:BrnT family toxin [Desulfosarcina sp. BuS5]